MGQSTGARGWLRLVGSLAIAALALALTSRGVGTVPDSFALPPWALPAYLGILVVYFLTRAWRWSFLVGAIAPVPARLAITVALNGFLWIVALPWRLGEFARPLILAEKAPITASAVLGTVALERVTDGLVVCGLFFFTLAADRSAPALVELYALATTVSALFLGALAVILIMALLPRSAGALLRRIVGRVHAGLGERLGSIADGIADGLRALPSPRPLLSFLVVTAIYWAVNASGMWVLAGACGLDLSLLEITAVMAVMNLALLVPGPPAHLGTFQLGVLAVLAIVLPGGLPRGELGDASVRFAFYLYTAQIGMSVALGTAAGLRLGIPWRGILRRLLGGGQGS